MVTNTKLFKIILKGSLEFGNEKSYTKVFHMYERRLETYYKKDILLSAEEMFNEETFSLNLPRIVRMDTEKKWKGTISLLKYLSQYAVAGSVSAWLIDGPILEQLVIEPDGDKVAVQAFLKGRELIKQAGKEDEAITALSKAIQKYERHAMAYEKRGYVNFQLKNYEDALYDFTKSINIYNHNPDAFFGRANVFLVKKELEKAVLDLDRTIKQSIPLQSVYFTARRIKGDCLIKLGDAEGAAREYKLVSARSPKFTPDNPNFKWRKRVFNKYGKVLLELGQYKDAVAAFNEAMLIEKEEGKEAGVDGLIHRGIALQKAGKKGFKSDWKKAAALGSKKAKDLIANC